MAKILLIEDEEFLRDIYKRTLDLANMPTDAAVNGKDGLKALENNTYDLVLLDIMLPDTNGLEILKQIKSQEKTKDIPVVLLTNLGQETIIKQGYDLGALGYLIKSSHNPDEIVEEVKNMLEGRGISSKADVLTS